MPKKHKKDKVKEKTAKQKPQLSKPKRTPQNVLQASQKKQYYPEALVGRRKVKGGAYEYQVKWKDSLEADNTWEPVEDLVGFEKEISEYNATMDAEYKKRAADLLKEKDARKKKLTERANRDLPGAVKEKAKEKQKDRPEGVDSSSDSDSSDSESQPEEQQVRGRQPRSRVWKSGAFKAVRNPQTGKITHAECKLHSEEEKHETCFKPILAQNGSTTGIWAHAAAHHRTSWTVLKSAQYSQQRFEQLRSQPIKNEGEIAIFDACRTPTPGDIQNLLPNMEEATLIGCDKTDVDAVVSEWIVDKLLPYNTASVDSMKTVFTTVSKKAIATQRVYDGCCSTTVKDHVRLFAEQGRGTAKDQLKLHREDGLKSALSGDLWSENGTALLGLCSHFITRDWQMRHLLTASVPCSKDSHTAKMIDAETDTALKDLDVWCPSEEIGVRVSDNGSNMKLGWSEGFWMGCRNHTDQRSVLVFQDHPLVKPTVLKASGLVGHFNHSTIGKNLLKDHQKKCRLPVCNLPQQMKVRWRTLYYMVNDLRVNMPAVISYDTTTKKPGDTYKANKLELAEWDKIEEIEAVLRPLSGEPVGHSLLVCDGDVWGWLM